VSVLSSATLLVSGSLLAVVWWCFADMLAGLLLDISMAPPEQLAFLSPLCEYRHLWYRESFLSVTIASLVLWYPVVTLALRKRQSMNRRVVVCGSGVVLLSLLLLDFPYRLLSHAGDFFAPVTWQGQHCYVLGTRGDDRLIFCPELPTPRNVVVRAAALTARSDAPQNSPGGESGAVVRKESIFTFLPIAAKKSGSRELFYR